MMTEKQHTIIASDNDPKMIEIAKINAKNAGVEKYITFEVKDVKEYLVTRDPLLGTVVSNPPYGLRLNNIVDLMSLYKTIATLFEKNPQLHGGIITSFPPFNEMKLSGNWKKSPFYNGGEQCRFYKKSLL
jgi:putative N6-adenine-specific DNA methylase